MNIRTVFVFIEIINRSITVRSKYKKIEQREILSKIDSEKKNNNKNLII